METDVALEIARAGLARFSPASSVNPPYFYPDRAAHFLLFRNCSRTYKTEVDLEQHYCFPFYTSFYTCFYTAFCIYKTDVGFKQHYFFLFAHLSFDCFSVGCPIVVQIPTCQQSATMPRKVTRTQAGPKKNARAQTTPDAQESAAAPVLQYVPSDEPGTPWDEQKWYHEAVRELNPGQPEYYDVRRREGRDPRDVTEFMPGQHAWSKDNLPDILYMLYPPPEWKKFKSTKPGPLLDRYGRERTERWPYNFQKARKLRDLPILPETIGSQEEEWYFEAVRRIDPRIRWSDITMRMPKQYRPDDNAAQWRLSRGWREAMGLLSWHITSRRGKSNNKLANGRVLDRLVAAGIDIDMNSTRGLTAGLIDPLGPNASWNLRPWPTQEKSGRDWGRAEVLVFTDTVRKDAKSKRKELAESDDESSQDGRRKKASPRRANARQTQTSGIGRVFKSGSNKGQGPIRARPAPDWNARVHAPGNIGRGGPSYEPVDDSYDEDGPDLTGPTDSAPPFPSFLYEGTSISPPAQMHNRRPTIRVVKNLSTRPHDDPTILRSGASGRCEIGSQTTRAATNSSTRPIIRVVNNLSSRPWNDPTILRSRASNATRAATGSSAPVLSSGYAAPPNSPADRHSSQPQQQNSQASDCLASGCAPTIAYPGYRRPIASHRGSPYKESRLPGNSSTAGNQHSQPMTQPMKRKASDIMEMETFGEGPASPPVKRPRTGISSSTVPASSMSGLTLNPPRTTATNFGGISEAHATVPQSTPTSATFGELLSQPILDLENAFSMSFTADENDALMADALGATDPSTTNSSSSDFNALHDHCPDFANYNFEL